MHVLITIIATLTDNAQRISLFKLTADAPSSHALLWCCYSCAHHNTVLSVNSWSHMRGKSTLWDIAVFFLAESFLLDERAKGAISSYLKCVAVATKRFDRF